MRLGFVAILIAAVGAVGVWFYANQAAPKSLVLRFTPTYGSEAFAFGTAYPNPGGDGEFSLRDFRLFVSNVVLMDGDQSHVVGDSYHLVRFDALNGSFEVRLDDLPLKKVDQIAFSVGLDEVANGSIETRGDLDPNSRMAWNWAIGYKFLLAEGSIAVDGKDRPLVYHVGFNENRRDLTFRSDGPVRLTSESELSFQIDIAQLFAGANLFDMAELSTIKMDRTDASLMADNFDAMIKINWGS